MPPNDTGERLARLEANTNHANENIRDIWNTMAELRNSYIGFSGKTDVFLAQAGEVLKRIDDQAMMIHAHQSKIESIEKDSAESKNKVADLEKDAAESKGRRTVMMSVVAMASSALGALATHYLPGK